MCKPWCTFVFPALLLNLSGTRSFLVRRHVGYGAPGSHPVLRETQQSGRHLRHSEAAEDYQLTEDRRNTWKDQKCEERWVKPDQSASTLMAGPWTLTGHAPLTNQDHTARPLTLTPLSPALTVCLLNIQKTGEKHRIVLGTFILFSSFFWKFILLLFWGLIISVKEITSLPSDGNLVQSILHPCLFPSFCSVC